jgi:hypothetical protein|tara:strand:- start:1762 stop:2766 length:1005 start_codon:yes stop_codon:yes gene_type:complete
MDTPEITGPITVHDASNLIERLESASEEQTEENSQHDESEVQTDGEVEEGLLEESPEEEFDDEESTDEEIDDEIDEEEEEAPTNYAVKVDGEEVEVSLDELLNGYSRQSSFTRKSQELAEERQTFQVESEAVKTERAQYAQLLGALQQQLSVDSSEPEPNWDDLYAKDPIEATRVERIYRQNKEAKNSKLQAINAEQQRLSQTQAQEQETQIRTIIAAESEKLVETIPSWKDEKVRDKERTELRSYLVEQGLSEDELSSLIRATHVNLLRKAYLYDKGVKRTKKAAKKPAGKTIRAGSRKPSTKTLNRQQKMARKQFNNSGRLDDATNLIESLM